MSAGYVPVLERDASIIRGAVAFLSGAVDAAPSERASRLEVQTDYRRRELYSYGRHFPLARYVPRNANGRRRRPLWIINGDAAPRAGGRWNRSRTPDHQSETRAAIRASGIDSIVLPFSALAGAGIDLDTVRPIHVRPDAEWTETRYADVLADVPRWQRTETYEVARSAREWESIPGARPEPYCRGRGYRPDYAHAYRERTADELAVWDGAPHQSWETRERAYLPILPDADGVYHWTESRERDRAPDADGRYSWTVRIHRLGDSLFAAARVDANGRRRNGRFLSSFDTNETPPLYFLAQVPRGAGDTVETATDALAPRAVHAAIARGRRVYRQGDIFFVETSYSREDLAAAGARFARLTLWTRDARPRPDEVNGRPRLTAPELRRRAAREARLRRKLWRESWHALESGAGRRADANALRRLEARTRWDELLARHSLERAAAAGADLDAPESAVCQSCGAAIGERCYRYAVDGALPAPRTVPRPDDMPESLARRINADLSRYGAHTPRAALAPMLERELGEARRAAREASVRRGRTLVAAPASSRGIRRQRARAVALAAGCVDAARVALRRAVLAGDNPIAARQYGYSNAYGRSALATARLARVARIQSARETYRRALESLEHATLTRARERDAYRNAARGAALELHRRAALAAAEKVRPDDVRFDSETFRRRREAIRGAVRIYGTAHTATELANVRGAVYARGRVRHVPELENTGGRWRDPRPDHRSFTLGAGDTWYLALRNTVPRQ